MADLLRPYRAEQITFLGGAITRFQLLQGQFADRIGVHQRVGRVKMQAFHMDEVRDAADALLTKVLQHPCAAKTDPIFFR